MICMDILLRTSTEIIWQPNNLILVIHFVACWMLEGQGKIRMKGGKCSQFGCLFLFLSAVLQMPYYSA